MCSTGRCIYSFPDGAVDIVMSLLFVTYLITAFVMGVKAYQAVKACHQEQKQSSMTTHIPALTPSCDPKILEIKYLDNGSKSWHVLISPPPLLEKYQ
jgi:hypothetical protein